MYRLGETSTVEQYDQIVRRGSTEMNQRERRKKSSSRCPFRQLTNHTIHACPKDTLSVVGYTQEATHPGGRFELRV
jgi:hypothetical protein